MKNHFILKILALLIAFGVSGIFILLAYIYRERWIEELKSNKDT